MTSVDLLVMHDYVLPDLVPCPPRVGEVSDWVLFACEHRNWNLDVPKRNLSSLLLSLEPIVVGVGEDLESILLQVLCVVQDVL